MYSRKGRILAGLLAMALVFTSGGVSALADETDNQGYTTGLCEHHPEHTADCGYDEATGTPCTYECDICGNDASEGEKTNQNGSGQNTGSEDGQNTEDTSQGTEPGGAATSGDTADKAETNETANAAMITDWSWIDEDGILQENDGVWGIGVPGASKDNPLTQDALLEMLPEQIHAVLSDGSEVTADLTWDLSEIPEEGVWSGEYTVSANVDGTYTVSESAAPLIVKVEVGGAETYASQTNLNANTVEGLTPKGTTINVFDYWLDTQDANDQSNPEDYGSKGINSGSELKFGQGMGTDANTSQNHLNGNTANHWTGTMDVRQGIVNNTLTNGFPTLNSRVSSNETSLDYLFSTSNEDAHEGKAVYPNAEGLLQVDEDGYFYYNSVENFAELDTSSTPYKFTLYEGNYWSSDDQRYVGGAVKAAGSSPDGQFFPFNQAEKVYEDSGQTGISLNDSITSTHESINHYFGLTMTTQFVQQYEGHTDESRNQAVTYEFSGDDDVWIFIDGVLVADLGGIHDAADLTIDFSTGEVVINEGRNEYYDANGNGSQDWNEPTASARSTTLRDQFEAAGMLGTTSWSDDTFANNTYHTLNFFYLERGNTDSNMHLRFNLVTIPESGVIKVDQAGNHIAGAEFTLYAADESYTKGTEICRGVTDDNGELIFVDEQGMIVSLADLYSRNIRYMVLEETSPPSGYRTTGDMHLYFYTPNDGQDVVLLSDNEWDTGSYASSKVTAQTGPEIILSEGRIIDLDTDGGILFAVVLQRQGTSTGLDDSNNWRAVYGDPESGWHVASDADMAAIINSAQNNPYEFEVTASGAYEANVEDLPGDITKYYYMLSDSNKGSAEYTIAYYYTSATSVEGATIYNTYRVNSDEFERVFSVNLYVPNIQNNLYVQKLDENGTPVSASIGTATFALYQAENVTINDNGTYTTVGSPWQTQTTSDMTTPLELTGGAMFSRIPIGEYYLIETSAPTGYVASGQAVHVIVDNTGVYADAGTETDAVSVRRGVGSVVRSMLQFATDDDVDTTLHDIKTELISGERSGNSFSWGKWDANDNNDLHLQFQNTHQVLEYGTYDGNGNPYFEVESGWSRLLVRQCLAHQGDEGINSKKQDLDDQDLTNLFSGTVTICIENQRINSLTISKTVVDESEKVPEGQKFTFTLTMTKATDEQLNGTYSVEGIGAPESGTVQFSNGTAELTLSHGESITIRNLPAGAHVKVTESDIAGQIYTTTYSIDNGAAVSGKETGELEITDSGSVNVAFTNTYVPTADFSFIKTDREGLDGHRLSGAVFAMYRLTCTDPAHNHNDSLIDVSDANIGVIDPDYEYAGCWELSGNIVTSGTDGVVTFEDLPIDAAEYRLVELKAPGGYALPEGQWRIVYDEEKQAFVPVESGSAVGRPIAIGTGDEGYYIQNYKPGELPFSGNTGIRMFLLIGGMLMILGAAGGTGWYLYHRKFMAVHGRRKRRRK